VNINVREFSSDIIGMPIEAREATARLPFLLNFAPGVREYRAEASIDRDFIAEFLHQLLKSALSGIGPDA